MSPEEKKVFGYGKMFEDAEAFCHTDDDLEELGRLMTSKNNDKDSKIPAGYTYLGQFIDHDIARDAHASGFPGGIIDINSIENLRSPFLDLDSLYGDGPVKSTELYKNKSKTLLKIGETVKENRIPKSFPNDLPRIDGTNKAILGDSRNDENLAVAQTHIIFIKFHNAVVNAIGDNNSVELFDIAKKIVTTYYQRIIIEDFLPRILKKSVLDEVLENHKLGKGNMYYNPDSIKPFMPIEFSVAAFRMGHCMIRSSYSWNPFLQKQEKPILADLRVLSDFTGRGEMSGSKIIKLPSRWIIDWTRFYDFSNVEGFSSSQGFNVSQQIDTTLNVGLGNILARKAADFGKRESSLAILDLFRCRALKVATGQSIAKIIKPERELSKSEIADTISNTELQNKFADNTPLWYYILAEAEKLEGGQNLGEVGSRIVAETFVALIQAKLASIPNDIDVKELGLKDNTEQFTMPDLLKFVDDQNKSDDEINPLKNF